MRIAPSEVFYDHLVVGVLLVVFEALRPHVAGDVVDRGGDPCGIRLVAESADHAADVLAVMLIGNAALPIDERAGRNGQLAPRGLRIGRIDIEPVSYTHLRAHET